MKNPFHFQFVLLGIALFLTGCSGSEDVVTEGGPPLAGSQIWKATVYASRDSISEVDEGNTETTRALFYGGNTRRYYTIWDEGDVLHVYKGDGLSEVGTMTPLSQYYGTVNAQMTGTLTGPFAVHDVLKTYVISRALNYTGQNGSINGLSANYAYAQATTEVTEAADNILTLSNVSPTMRQEFLRFVFTDEETGERLHPTRLDITAIEGGHIVESMAEDGTVTPCDVLTIVPEEDNGEYPGELFVALVSENNANVTYRLKVTVGSNVFIGPIAVDGQNVMRRSPDIGRLTRILRKMRKATAVNTLTVENIGSKTFTGFPIDPEASEIVVKDGEDVLTQGTDYSFEFSNNTNVGNATVTITGLAETGERASTKYIGETTTNFSIVQATPVIVMDATTMELVNNGTQNTATRTVTRVFIDNNGNGTWDEGTDYDITGLCTVTYSTDNDAVATVNETSGLVTAAGFGTTTITATVVGATNWTSQTATYTVNVEQEVNGQNTVNPWTSGGEPEGGKIYVE